MPPSEWTVLAMLKWATSYFGDKGIRNSRFSIEWLLAHVLKVKRLDIYLLYDRPLTKEELEELRPLVKRRSLHEPLQYITRSTDFLNAVIKVSPEVLIPRMETEQMIEMILEKHSSPKKCTVLDIGTGSGCIPVALKKNREEWNIYATDISKGALLVAEENASLNNTKIEFIHDDIFDSKASFENKMFDIIISNPPYILENEKESLDKEVREFEPASALFCKSTMSMYGAIKIFSEKYLAIDGNLYLELHENNAREVRSIFAAPNWDSSIHLDYGGKERFLVVKKLNN